MKKFKKLTAKGAKENAKFAKVKYLLQAGGNT